jgi:ribonucleoside-diphosphate reductase alpha chain
MSDLLDREEFYDSLPRYLRNTIEGHLSNFNMSVGITDEFMQAVKADEKFTFKNPRTEEPHVATEETLELWEQFGYGEYIEVGEVLRVPAREVWSDMIHGAHQNGEPGCVFIDRINDEHSFDPEQHPEYVIEATNLCITGETMIPTKNGLRTAENLYKDDLQSIVVDSRLSNDRIKQITSVDKVGLKPVVRLATEEGYEMRLTEDHNIMTDDGWVEAGNLSPGETVHIQNQEGGFSRHGSAEEGRVMGWLVADGHLKQNEERAVLSFYDKDTKLSEQFAEDVNSIIRDHRLDKTDEVGVMNIDNYNSRSADSDSVSEDRIRSTRLYEYAENAGLVKKKLQVPDIVMSGSREMATGFLQALFTADGSVQGAAHDGSSVRLHSTSADMLADVQRLLLNFNIASKIYHERRDAQSRQLPDGKGGTQEYECESTHDLVISKDNLVRFREQIGFLRSEKQNALQKLLDSYNKGPYSEYFTATVETVEEDGKEAVYNLTEPDTRSFIGNGIVLQSH